MSDIERARELIDKGQREEAISLLEQTLAKNIDQIDAWRMMAHIVSNVNEITECYEHVLRLDPHDAEAISNLSSLSVQNNNSNVLPFFSEDYTSLSDGWETSGETPEQPGEAAAPAVTERAVSSGGRLPPVQPLKPEELLALDELDENESATARKDEKPGLLENDAFFYPIILLVIIAVLVLLFFLFRNSLPAWLSSLLPF
jgi:tetratricopeptide (TPR) repeat protein